MSDGKLAVAVFLFAVASMLVGIAAGNLKVCEDASKKGVWLRSCIFNQEIER